MMKSIEELSEGASNIQATQVKRWREDLIEAARAKRKFEQVAFRTEVGEGVKDYRVPISDVVDFSGEEVHDSPGSEVNFTDLTGKISSQTFSPTYRRNAVRIPKQAVEENKIDVIEFARKQLVEYAAKRVDSLIRNKLEGDVTTGNLAGLLYGGDAADTSEITSGDVLTTDMIADGIKKLRSKNYQNTDDEPFVLFIHPKQEGTLMKSSQFVNASEYGSDEVVLNGEIGKYLGVKVISTSQVKTYTSGTVDDTDSATGGWGADGASVYLFKAKRPVGIAWKKEAEIEADEDLDYNEQRIYLSMKFDTGLLQEDALCIMKVADE